MRLRQALPDQRGSFKEGLQMDMTLRLNFEGQTSVGQIQRRRHSFRGSSMGKVWQCENCMWFSEEVTDVN